MPAGLYNDSFTGQPIVTNPYYDGSYNLLQVTAIGTKLYMKRQLGTNLYVYDANTNGYTWLNFAPFGSGSRLFNDGADLWCIMEKTKEVISYDVSENKWSRPVGIGRWGHDGKTYSIDADGKMLVYTSMGKWTRKTAVAPLITVYYHGDKPLMSLEGIGFCGLGKYLYFLNGRYNYSPYNPNCTFFLRYDTEEDEWEDLLPIDTTGTPFYMGWRSHVLIGSGRYIYVLGGYDSIQGFESRIFRYDTIADDWSILTDIFGSIYVGALYGFLHDGQLFATRQEYTNGPLRIYRISSTSGKSTVLGPSDLPITTTNMAYGNGRLYTCVKRDRGSYANPR
jgi:hypothetical protein